MSDKSTAQQRQIWLIFLFLGVIMLNFPFLQIFNHINTFCGIPVLVLYLLVGWPISILVIYIFAHTIKDDSNSSEKEDD
ncbi:MAG: hypothetical protein RBR22_06495 [Desulfuromonas sp.]|nr:hypothetical protein [Desulfuromonas sp.]